MSPVQRDGPMPNRPRPRCPACDKAMEPLFAKRVRGDTFARVEDAFWCRACGALAKGRDRSRFLA